MSTSESNRLRLNSANRMRSSYRSGFTLVELLVVISVISLLIAILIPTLSRARHQVRSVACRSNLKQLMTGMLLYVTDDGAFPGTHGMFYFQNLFGAAWPRPAGVTWDGARDRIVGLNVTAPYSKPYHLDPEFVDDVPGKGTLFPYMKDENVYRCPTDQPGESNSTATGGGGNGRLSYSLNAYAGYKAPEQLSGFTYVADSLNNPLPSDQGSRDFRAGEHVNFAPARFKTMFEEHPATHINGDFPDGSFNGLDHVATRHMPATDANGTNPRGRANIAFLDGHAEGIIYPARTEGRQLFTEFSQPYFWRRSGPPDQANASAFVKRLAGECPW